MSTLPATTAASTSKWFKAKVLDFNIPKGADPGAISFALNNPENDALSLAQREQFDVMCEKILWGSEDKEAFGEMLRSIVIAFQPKDVFQLHLLRNIAALQWQLQRLESVQNNLFSAGAEVVGAYGLPRGTSDAMEFTGQASNLLRDLQRAIQIYKTARKK